MLSSAFRESWNVLGSMLGKIIKAKGKANSINGMMMNIEKGIKRNRSVTVRSNCFLSLLVKDDPRNVLPTKVLAVCTSAQRSFSGGKYK